MSNGCKIDIREKGVLLRLEREDEFCNSNTQQVQEWYFKKKILILGFKLLEKIYKENSDMKCEVGNGVYWFKTDKIKQSPRFICFIYQEKPTAGKPTVPKVIAFAKIIGEKQKPSIPINDIYEGYFVVSDIVVFKEPMDNAKINQYFKKANEDTGIELEKVKQNHLYIQFKDDLDVLDEEKNFQKIQQKIIDEAKELSENDRWKSLKDAPAWFKNIEEFCKF